MEPALSGTILPWLAALRRVELLTAGTESPVGEAGPRIQSEEDEQFRLNVVVA